MLFWSYLILLCRDLEIFNVLFYFQLFSSPERAQLKKTLTTTMVTQNTTVDFIKTEIK